MNRSKKFVFLPFCVLSQAVQAQGIVKYEWKSSIKPIVNLLLENDINIVQMPCPESSFNGFGKSLIRPPKNIEGYDNQMYKIHCENLADGVVEMIESCVKEKYEVLAVLSIDKSPSCSNGFVHTDDGGLIERKGVYIESLERKLQEKGLNVEIIGINKKDISGALKQLEILIKKW